MRSLKLLMDDSSIKNPQFIIEENIEKVKNYTYKLGSSMLYSVEELYSPNQLGSAALTNLVIF
ncbi:MAG TPA: hypothetical protein P5556_11110 [Candidatus Gastranaerophilales bacterium]|nr:hypothetical protein [Candidatus Gastranaerophilales bacterium]